MKILLVSNELGYRGTPRFLAYCAIIARQAGHDVLVWGLDEEGAAADMCRHNKIDVISGEQDLSTAEQFNPDIVHIHRGGGPSNRDIQILQTLKKTCFCKVLETNVFGIADFSSNLPIDLHAHISYWDLWRWRRWLWPFHQAGIALPYCLDTESFKPTASNLRQTLGIPTEAFLIGRLGKTDWTALSVTVKECLSANPNIWFLTVDDYSTGNHMTWPDNIRKRIVTHPRINGTSALCHFYSACDVTVNFSSIGESFGYGIAESMSCGTPVIALSKPRNDNAQIELAAPEHGGFPVTDASIAINVILELASNRARLATASAKCRESIVQRYSIAKFAPQLLKAYALLHSSSAHGQKLEKVFEDNGFLTQYSEQKILQQLSNVHGGSPSRLDMLKMRLAYSFPNAVRNYLRSQFS